MKFSILTADLSFEYIDMSTSKKHPFIPTVLSLSNNLFLGTLSKALLKSTKQQNSIFRCLCGFDFTYFAV